MSTSSSQWLKRSKTVVAAAGVLTGSMTATLATIAVNSTPAAAGSYCTNTNTDYACVAVMSSGSTWLRIEGYTDQFSRDSGYISSTPFGGYKSWTNQVGMVAILNPHTISAYQPWYDHAIDGNTGWSATQGI